MERMELLAKLQDALSLGDSPVKGPFGTYIRKEYLAAAIEEIEKCEELSKAKSDGRLVEWESKSNGDENDG